MKYGRHAVWLAKKIAVTFSNTANTAKKMVRYLGHPVTFIKTPNFISQLTCHCD